ncbi:MAG: DUF1232 domain-containing protein [Anaerolineales bacterium]|nr:MAG: DUF1232 domain-containing protein [Anaerolineales bacterium]
MNEQQHPVPAGPKDTTSILDWARGAVRKVRLVWRLLRDSRVPMWTKLIPPAVMAYVLSPLDFISDWPMVGINQLDDLAVFLLGFKVFLDLAPADVVREHLRALGAQMQEWRVVEEADDSPSEGGETSDSGRIKLLELEEDSP